MKAPAYARYSTDKQTENSIDTQLTAITRYCENNDIVVVATFVDMAMTGTNTERPNFQRMLEAAKSKQFEAVVICDISRASRDVSDWLSFRKLMQSYGVQVISTTDKLGQFDDPSAFLSELLTAGLGQHMILQTRQKSILCLSTHYVT
jgi:site-specific DNA recombinase